jgi:hypothetical protein
LIGPVAAAVATVILILNNMMGVTLTIVEGAMRGEKELKRRNKIS